MSLSSEAFQQALADHERDNHGASETVAIPDDCMADVKQRYDAMVAKLGTYPPFGIGDRVVGPRGPARVVGMAWKPPYDIVNPNSTYTIPGRWDATVIYDAGPDLAWAGDVNTLKPEEPHA